jgi:hypothetical protein
MQARLTLITLGVADVARATAFYERLGFVRGAGSNAHVSFFQAGGVVLALFGRQALAEDAHMPADSPANAPGVQAPAGFAGISLAHNVRSEAEVDAVLAEAVAAGARLTKPAQSTFWGGYAGYFTDLDGHLWEVAHNPFLPLTEAGIPQLPL